MPGRKIFIVDDEEDILESLNRRLTADGYAVVTAATGRDAVQKIKQVDPDLLLVDIVLPDIDGPEIIQRLKNDPQGMEKPVIFFSGIVSKEGQGKTSTVKVAGHEYPALGKPFAYEELVKLMAQYI